jgi:uncharacterized Ntn-hydrolase superfamily protein
MRFSKIVLRSNLLPTRTYSIVARDVDTGQLGVAVQSHYFGVGAIVPWAEAGIGVVVTQAFAETSYGCRGLELMRAGRAAPDALNELVAQDRLSHMRQVAMVDARGHSAAHTGSSTIAEAGHIIGEGFSVQANMMLRSSVWGAMAEAYRSTRGELVERLLAALEAAEAEGGDIRGRQSAALLIVRDQSSGRAQADKLFDLRVDDASEPLVELWRLVRLSRGYDHLRRAQAAVEGGDLAAVNSEYDQAAALLGDNQEARFWQAVTLMQMGQTEAGLALLGRIAAINPNWRALALRLPDFILRDCDHLFERIRKL